MIAAVAHADDTPATDGSGARLLTDPATLLERLGLDAALLPAARRAAERFPMRVPAGFVARMRPGDPADPLLRQVLPLADELATAGGFGADPVGDAAARVAPGLLHKYAGRALLLVTGACAIHCRYCFRREYPYADTGASPAGWEAAFAHLHADRSIRELILSGGDPLTLSNRRLRELVQAADAVPQLERLRIHTRQPVVDPGRIDAGLLAALRSRLPVVLVLHVNHAREIDAALVQACARLRAAGVTLLNQSVLLAGVNDDADTLAALMRAFVESGAKPYYLHHPDLAPGTAHFRLPIARGLALVRGLRGRISGLAQPTYVLDIPGGHGKVALDGAAAQPVGEGVWELADFRGRAHLYREA